MLQSCWKIVDYSNIVRYLDSSWFQKLFILYHWRTLAYKIFEWNCDNRSDWNYPIEWWQTIEIDTYVIRLLSNQLLHYYCYLNFEVELVTVVCSQSLLHIRFLNTVTNFDPSDVELSLRLVIECDVFVIWNTRCFNLRYGWMKVRWFLVLNCFSQFYWVRW